MSIDEAIDQINENKFFRIFFTIFVLLDYNSAIIQMIPFIHKPLKNSDYRLMKFFFCDIFAWKHTQSLKEQC